MKRYREVIGGSVFFLFAATYFVMAFQIPTFNDGFISSDFMPKVYGAILMLLSVIQIIQGAFRSLRAFALFRLETKILFGPFYSIGSTQSKPRMGQAEAVSSKKPRTGLGWSSRLDSSRS